LPELIDQVAYSGARIPIAKHGKPMAALVSYADLQRLEDIEEMMDMLLLRRAVAGMPVETGKDLDAVIAERIAAAQAEAATAAPDRFLSTQDVRRRLATHLLQSGASA
jgi:prevent-host-death family protein